MLSEVVMSFLPSAYSVQLEIRDCYSETLLDIPRLEHNGLSISLNDDI